MPFQTTVRIDQTSGIVGEVIFIGPQRAQPKTIRSPVEANNVVGRAFTQLPGAADSNVVAAGGVVAQPFAGILVNPKVYATSGPTTGALDPTLTLRNEEEAEFLTMGIIIVLLDAAAAIGDAVNYTVADGTLTLSALSAGVIEPIPNCTVVRETTTAAGLAYVQLTN